MAKVPCICAHCGAEFALYPYRVKNSKTGIFFCSLKCMGEQRTGENSLHYVERRSVASKPCTKCGNERQASEFGADLKRSDGLQVWCKECKRASDVAKKEADPELYKARKRAVERRLRISDEYRKRRCESALRYVLGHPETVKARRRKYNTSERARELYRASHQRHKERRYAYTVQRRARLVSAPKIERIDRVALAKRDNFTCYLCGGKLSEGITLDHVVPLSRGGEHTADNLKVACLSCNCRKGTKLLAELDWYTAQ